MTLPFFFLVDFAYETLPTLQCEALTFALAAASFLPTTFGTTHAGGVAFWLKVAVTDLLPFIMTLHWPRPLQSPLQPRNVDLFTGWLSVRFTTVPAANEAEHVAPQLMPPPVTVPKAAPVPTLETFSV